MDHDLRSAPSAPFRQNSNLPKVIAKSTLLALVLLQEVFGAIHTDINPNNIFLSDIHSPSPIVKVGDLGNMLKEGYKTIRLQSLTTRAPEGWRDLGCWPSSDVWSLGITLTHWLSSPNLIFGAKDKIVQDLTETWCIAKIQRLLSTSISPPVNPAYEEEFLVSGVLERGTLVHPDTKVETRFIKMGTLREELEGLEGLEVDKELIEFIEDFTFIEKGN
ncbi:hypothetical protein G7Y89_g13021 [Cudoniella acicularis]|uniref:Protein kinase domain-containing protein n=1 Tax=Cudoniella acicularis TaxID=354080 RepID=A0A8H4R812_9HELO|nr:hypothetical protein G7Y89_g13021 [Cudoniella acicularis]